MVLAPLSFSLGCAHFLVIALLDQVSTCLALGMVVCVHGPPRICFVVTPVYWRMSFAPITPPFPVKFVEVPFCHVDVHISQCDLCISPIGSLIVAFFSVLCYVRRKMSSAREFAEPYSVRCICRARRSSDTARCDFEKRFGTLKSMFNVDARFLGPSFGNPTCRAIR